MKAIRIHQFGPTEEALQFEEVPTPQPGPQEVLVKIEAASLNRADLGLRRGQYRVKPEELPLIPGREFAGIVEALGPSVQEFRAGQRVVAHAGRGGYAEYAVAKVSQTRPVPDGIESVVAAAVPTVFLTAWFALMEEARIKKGDRVLIQAGASGVGTAGIQIAKHAGTKVITTAGSEEKCRRLSDLGTDHVVNYTVQDFKQEVLRLTDNEGVNAVFEMVGGEIYKKSIEVLAPGGRLVSIGGAAGPIPETPPALTEGRTASRFSITAYLSSHPEAFKQVDSFLSQVKEKKLKVVIGRTFPLAEARAAQRYLEGRDHFGKVMLVMHQ